MNDIREAYYVPINFGRDEILRSDENGFFSVSGTTLSFLRRIDDTDSRTTDDNIIGRTITTETNNKRNERKILTQRWEVVMA